MTIAEQTDDVVLPAVIGVVAGCIVIAAVVIVVIVIRKRKGDFNQILYLIFVHFLCLIELHLKHNLFSSC